jgi:glutamate 5-kinase
MNSVRRVVLKLGTKMVTSGPYRLDTEAITRLAIDIADLRKKNYEVLIVSSGAIAAGMGRMNLRHRPKSIPHLQALAAIGQNLLMNAYEKALGMLSLPIAQVLLTIDDIHDRKRYVNVQNTLNELIRLGVIPIINENDTVGTEEVKVGDNDNLSAYVTSLATADLLVLFTDVDGLFSGVSETSHGQLLPLVTNITPELYSLCNGTGDIASVGGMRTKLEAAEHVLRGGGMVIIANGRTTKLSAILAGDEVGTLFRSEEEGMNARQHWIAMTAKVCGAIRVDKGAARAISDKNASLLPKGITAVDGNFDLGDVVSIMSPEGEEIARGTVLYSSHEIQKIIGKHSDDIEDVLGYTNGSTIIHRNDMAHVKKV